MSVLQELMNACIRSPEALREPLNLNDGEVEQLRQIARRHPICVSPYYLSLIGPDWRRNPIGRLCIPDPAEHSGEGAEDTGAEAENTVVPGMQHKYRQTALVLTTDQCPVYCRHCFRRQTAGPGPDEAAKHLGEMAEYVRVHPEIDNVLLSGGDALILDNRRLAEYLEAFSAIDHLRFIRIGTRVPVALPRRVIWDHELLELLRRYNQRRQIIVVTHFNHPRELTDESRRAVRALIEVGCPVRNQAVLLKDINDAPETLAALMNGLTAFGVLPYYLFQCRPATGAMNRFQVPILAGQRVVDGARAMMNGQARGFRYVMSHVTGKIEILGRPDGGDMLFRYHQARCGKDAFRFFTARLREDQCWLEDGVG